MDEFKILIKLRNLVISAIYKLFNDKNQFSKQKLKIPSSNMPQNATKIVLYPILNKGF